MLCHWQVMPGDETPSFVQLWLPPNAHQVEFRVTPPGLPTSPWIKPGDALVSPNIVNPSLWRDYPPHTSRGNHGTMVLVALATCTSFKPKPLAPHGIWQVEVKNSAVTTTEPADSHMDRSVMISISAP